MGSGRVTTHTLPHTLLSHLLGWDSRIQFEIVHSKNWGGTVGNDSRRNKNQSTDERVRILELEEKLKARATAKYVHGDCYIFR